MSGHAAEVARGQRFQFGANWAEFLRVLDEERIGRAVSSLQEMLGVGDLKGKRFLDVGSGSGLFSLAARRLGADVVSFDYDPQSVACTLELRRRYFPEDGDWKIQEGSALDAGFLRSLGTFDVVYSWGVLHHTGQMWEALANATIPVGPGGALFIAIYNDMGRESDRWRSIKKTYCSLPSLLRPPFAILAMLPYEVKALGRSILHLKPGDYFASWTRYSGNRGMNRWRDIIDWVGGYPYEAATTEEIEAFYDEQGFELRRVEATRGLGCNEFVFRKRRVKNRGTIELAPIRTGIARPLAAR